MDTVVVSIEFMPLNSRRNVVDGMVQAPTSNCVDWISVRRDSSRFVMAEVLTRFRKVI
jgi:hypothetical protein